MDLIPAPRTVVEGDDDGAFTLDEATTVHADVASSDAGAWLRAALGAATGLPLLGRAARAEAEQAEDGVPNAIELRVSAQVTAELGSEGYRLDVGPGGASVRGGGPAGVFWGAQTLRQLLPAAVYRRAPVADQPWVVPAVSLADAPRFGWRGALLDVARHFMPKDAVLRFVDVLAAHKLNVLHLHLTDDQGWRIEIARYPRLTEVGSWRSRTMVGASGSDQWDERPHGGFYRQDDLREIVAYAAARQITVIPEIDVPGHSQAAIAAYPELGNDDVVDTSSLETFTDWGVCRNVLSVDPEVLEFYEGVLTEVLDVFPARFVHIGGDECPREQWRASPAAQRRMRELGLPDEDALQSWFVRHFDRWLAERGRRLIGWDEILEGAPAAGESGVKSGDFGLSTGAAVSSWRGYEGGIAAASAGHDVVMCPEQRVYLNWRQTDSPDEPVPVGQARTLRDVYSFEPVPAELTAAQAEHVLGTQANMWTENTDSPRSVDYQLFPRLAAFAEVAWSALPPAAERHPEDFERRLESHYRRLDAMGVEYRPPEGPRPWQRRPGVPGRPVATVPVAD